RRSQAALQAETQTFHRDHERALDWIRERALLCVGDALTGRSGSAFALPANVSASRRRRLTCELLREELDEQRGELRGLLDWTPLGEESLAVDRFKIALDTLLSGLDLFANRLDQRMLRVELERPGRLTHLSLASAEDALKIGRKARGRDHETCRRIRQALRPSDGADFAGKRGLDLRFEFAELRRFL